MAVQEDHVPATLQARWRPGERPDLVGRPLVPFFGEPGDVPVHAPRPTEGAGAGAGVRVRKWNKEGFFEEPLPMAEAGAGGSASPASVATGEHARPRRSAPLPPGLAPVVADMFAAASTASGPAREAPPGGRGKRKGGAGEAGGLPLPTRHDPYPLTSASGDGDQKLLALLGLGQETASAPATPAGHGELRDESRSRPPSGAGGNRSASRPSDGGGGGATPRKPKSRSRGGQQAGDSEVAKPGKRQGKKEKPGKKGKKAEKGQPAKEPRGRGSDQGGKPSRGKSQGSQGAGKGKVPAAERFALPSWQVAPDASTLPAPDFSNAFSARTPSPAEDATPQPRPSPPPAGAEAAATSDIKRLLGLGGPGGATL